MGLFCRIQSLLQGSFEKETYTFREPTNRSHPIVFYIISTPHKYGVATISRILKIIGLFCRILSFLQGSFAKETYIFKEPTNCSHHIVFHTSSTTYLYVYIHMHIYVIKMDLNPPVSLITCPLKRQRWTGLAELRYRYEVATISRLLKITGLFCKRAL